MRRLACLGAVLAAVVIGLAGVDAGPGRTTSPPGTGAAYHRPPRASQRFRSHPCESAAARAEVRSAALATESLAAS